MNEALHVAVDEGDVLDSSRAGGLAIRGSILRVASYGAAMALSLLTVPFVTRHLGPVDYGLLVSVQAIVFIIAAVTEAGLTNIGVRQYAVLTGAERTDYLRVLAGLRFALTTLGTLVAVVLVAATGRPDVVIAGTALGALGLLLTLVAQTYAIPLEAQLRLGWISAIDLAKHTSVAIVTLALVATGAALLPFFAAPIAGGIVVLVAVVLLVRHEGTLRPIVDPRRYIQVTREVLPYALAAAAGLLYLRLALIVMNYLADEVETGLYAIAFRVLETAGVIPSLVVSAAFPILARAARDDADRLRYALQRLFEVAALAGGLLSLVLAVGASFAIAVLGGPAFADATPVLRLQALSLVTSFLVATWSFGLLSLGSYGALLRANLLAIATSVGLTVALVPPFGAEGAAVATFAAEVVLGTVLVLVLRRAGDDLGPRFGSVMRLVPGTLLGVGVALALSLPALAEALVAGAVYLVAAFALRVVPPELIAALRERRGGRARA